MNDNGISYVNPDITNKHPNVADNDATKVISQKHYHNATALSLLEEHQPSLGPVNGTDAFHNTQETILGFGSDSSFANQHFAPPPGMEGMEDVEGRMLRTLRSLETVTSAASTQPSSPINSKTKRNTVEADLIVPSGSISRSKKRRKPVSSEFKSEDSTSEEHETQTNRRKPAKSGNAVHLTDSPQPTRRKTRSNEPKRANLTEQEKRENHIRSEQKRRNQIREGFSNLLALMPENISEGSTSSKCLILSRAVEWMTSLSEGNEKLRAQLELLRKPNA